MKTMDLSGTGSKVGKGGKGGKAGQSVRQQAGGFVMGLVAGLLIGLAVALGVALYITKAPSLFLNKVPQRTAEQDTAETERNRNWDPNAPLSGKAGNHSTATSGAVTAASAPAAATTPSTAAPAPATTPAAVPAAPPAPVAPPVASASAAAPAVKPAAKDPAAILAGGATAAPRDPYIYFVQAGAYTRSDDAEQQKAKLALNGMTARITEREQAGRTVYRVRLGPFPSRDEADALQVKLQEQTIEAQIVRVEKP